jgi:hypothetical protein
MRSKLRTLVTLLTIYVLITAIFYLVEWWILAPPSNLRDLEQLRSRFPQSEVHRIKKDGDIYFVVIGGYVFPNEYSAGYLFDGNGRFLGWAAEASDVDALSPFWNLASTPSDNTRISWQDAIVQARSSSVP